MLRFQAAVIGAATSQRGSSPRWSELVVYRMVDGHYLISKIGRSTVAHQPTCLRVNHRMVPWSKAAAFGEDSVQRVPCPDCRPELGHGIAPDTMLEVTRYRAILCQTAESAAESLMGDRAALLMPQIVQTVLAQCSESDPNFSRYAEADTALPRAWENTTRTP
ncbi:MAG TPA: hypothetical protein VF632_24930 [Longimicrobium sp.]